MAELLVGGRLVPVNQINQASQMVSVECVSVRDLQDSGIILYFLLTEIRCKLQRTNRLGLLVLIVGDLKTLQANANGMNIRATINPSNPNGMNTTKK